MPSFLDDDNAPIFSANSDVLDLDPHNQFDIASDKIDRPNGYALGHSRIGPINESFDTSSTLSTRDSDPSDATPMPVNENGTRPTSMSSYTNGNISGNATNNASNGISPPVSNGGVDTYSDTMPNGKTALADRTLPPQHPIPSANDYATQRSSGDASHKTVTPASLASSNHSPTDSHQALSQPFPDVPTRPPPATPSELDHHSSRSQTPTAPPGAASSISTSDRAPDRGSPHRFSSPPAYIPSTSPVNAPSPTTTGHLQPPAVGSTLKHRHTLEVPKVPPGRLSKDGVDGSQTGRFSPAVAGPGARRASLNLARRTTRSMQSDAPRDEIVRDEDAVRWAEAYRQKRASKRRRKEEEDDDRVLVGTRVDETHTNWVTAYNMLTGIRVSVSRTNAKLDRELTNADFEAKQKSTFDITGNELVPSAKYDFKFKDYAPWVFRRLRSLFRLDPADYLMSLTGKYILSELGSPGKSGSFFYFSRDYKYIIKTIHHAEHKFLRKTLKDYYTHIQDNPNTLLSQFYGLHRVKLPYGKKIHFVVMNNLFPPHRDIHTTFDLKGSTVGRNYKEEDLDTNPRATLKDLNWLRRQQNLELGIQKKRLFLEQLQRDVVLLKRLHIMDYSLLIGIHDLSRGNDENLRDKTLQVFNPGGEKPTEEELPVSALLRTPSKLESVRKARELRHMIRQERPVPMGLATDKMPDELGEGHNRPGFVFNQDDGGFRATHEDNAPADEIYYLGVIDCLTHYGVIKKIEHFWKGLSKDRTQISALPPEQYGDRFYNFIEGITMSPEAAVREAERREQEAVRAQVSIDKASTRTHRHKSSHAIPPMPEHQPPSPPVGPQSPAGRETIQMARKELRRTEMDGDMDKHAPERTLKASATTPVSEGRNSLQHESILPIVEEDGENSLAQQRSKTAPCHPSKSLPPVPTDPPPPPPPAHSSTGPPTSQQAYLKPDSSDSGYGDNSNGALSRDNSLKVRARLSQESLNKTLPPLPKEEEMQDSGIRMVM